MLVVENHKVNFNENFGLLKFNGSSNFQYRFDPTKLNNNCFYIDEINEIYLNNEYKYRPDLYYIVLDIGGDSYYLTLELLKPKLVLSNNVINLNSQKHIGFLTISDLNAIYSYKTNTPNFEILTNDLFIKDNSIVSKYSVEILAICEYCELSYEFSISIIPTISLTNTVVYLNTDDFFISKINNNDDETLYTYSLDPSLNDNKYFDIIDSNKLVVKDSNFNNKDDIYTINIHVELSMIDLEFNQNIFVNINKIKNVYTDLKVVLTDKLKYNYHFNKQISDIIEFSIESLVKERKVKLVFISGGSLFLSGNNKISENTIIYLQPNIEYYIQYQNKSYETNKIIFHIESDNNFGILEIMITLNNDKLNKTHIKNMENIAKANFRTSIKTQNPNCVDTLNVQVFKLNNIENKKCVSKLVNGLQIFYTHDTDNILTRSLDLNTSLVIEPIKLDGVFSGLPAFYIKYIDNNTYESLISMSTPLTIILYLPNYKGKTSLSAYRLHDSISGYDGTEFPLTPYYNTPNNSHFSLTLTTNSIYTINDTSYGAQCFLRGSSILTECGYEKVENLKVGDILLTHNMRQTTIREIVKLDVPSNSNNDPYLIPKNVFGAITNLYLSPLHQILIGDTFVPVKYIPNLKQVFKGFNLEYYHFKTDDYFSDTVIADGVITETWSGYDPMEYEFKADQNFINKYNDVKMEHNYRKLITT
jgi:hypothetical protein